MDSGSENLELSLVSVTKELGDRDKSLHLSGLQLSLLYSEGVGVGHPQCLLWYRLPSRFHPVSLNCRGTLYCKSMCFRHGQLRLWNGIWYIRLSNPALVMN